MSFFLSDKIKIARLLIKFTKYNLIMSASWLLIIIFLFQHCIRIELSRISGCQDYHLLLYFQQLLAESMICIYYSRALHPCVHIKRAPADST